MIDTHCHLDVKQFNKDRDDVIERARQQLRYVINPATDFGSNIRVQQIQKQHRGFVFACMALDPVNFVKQQDRQNEFIELARQHSNDIVAIGEVGLDYYWLPDKKGVQQSNFIAMIELANELKKTLVIHSRNAMEDALEILERHANTRVVMHCFSGNKTQMKRCWDSNYITSFATSICRMGKVLSKSLDLDKIVVETDSPYLNPVSTERNEPVNVKYAIQKIAEKTGTTFEEIEAITDKNAMRAFNL
ncbi:MAG: TatD family hydrolase [DPANN group archaeon]|nr:TatD family hydrolase [DPANN group archaeon]